MKTWQFGLTTTLGAVALAGAGAGIGLSAGNRSLQGQINQRQQFLQQSVQLEALRNQLVRALAERAASSGDGALREMLARNGVRYTVTPPSAAAAPAPEAKATRKATR